VESNFAELTVSAPYPNCNTKWAETLEHLDGSLVVSPSGWSRSIHRTFWVLYLYKADFFDFYLRTSTRKIKIPAENFTIDTPVYVLHNQPFNWFTLTNYSVWDFLWNHCNTDRKLRSSWLLLQRQMCWTFTTTRHIIRNCNYYFVTWALHKDTVSVSTLSFDAYECF
jgi:hypothetical protein